MKPAMISAASYAEKIGCSISSVRTWCLKGQIPGAVRIPWPNSSIGYAYLIPEDAIPIRKKRGRPKATCSGPERAPYPYPHPKPKRTYSRREMALFIRKHAGNMTYAQLVEELGIPRDEVRKIYERLHKRYGI